MNILISPARQTDFPAIARYAAEFILDCEEMSWNEFLVAKKNDMLIGFGRLRKYKTCTELSTLGVIPDERNKGTGSQLTRELIRIAPSGLYVICVIPGFFKRFGFQTIKNFPAQLEPKVRFCMGTGYCRDEVSVMALSKP